MNRKPLPMTRLQALKKGIELPPVPRFSHYDWVQDAPDAALLDVLTNYGKLNLKDQRDPENRWKGERLKAARYEVRRRALNLQPATA